MLTFVGFVGLLDYVGLLCVVLYGLVVSLLFCCMIGFLCWFILLLMNSLIVVVLMV